MKKILIVDDEISIIKLLSAKLSAKYTIVSAENGKKGLEAAEKEQPDLILSDINMPIMDGMEMLAELRKSSFGKTVKIIMLTNLEPSEAIAKKAAEGEPTYYLIKANISIADLVKKIDELLI